MMTRPTRSGNTAKKKKMYYFSEMENIDQEKSLTVDEVVANNGAVAETPVVNEGAGAIDLVSDGQNIPDDLYQAILSLVPARSFMNDCRRNPFAKSTGGRLSW